MDNDYKAKKWVPVNVFYVENAEKYVLKRPLDKKINRPKGYKI